MRNLQATYCTFFTPHYATLAKVIFKAFHPFLMRLGTFFHILDKLLLLTPKVKTGYCSFHHIRSVYRYRFTDLNRNLLLISWLSIVSSTGALKNIKLDSY